MSLSMLVCLVVEHVVQQPCKDVLQAYMQQKMLVFQTWRRLKTFKFTCLQIYSHFHWFAGTLTEACMQLLVAVALNR